MTRDRHNAKHGLFGRRNPSEDARVQVQQHEGGDDWPLLSALVGGLALALFVNTFIGLIPG
ncbi:MAG: hypothetical protein DCF30_03540 [Hyphomicrobiales bacterium]|nr:MAG: hypothetical protein DCF30_03540 [Hyphomicrobiales bacterium]